jgi:hypothetical protein
MTSQIETVAQGISEAIPVAEEIISLLYPGAGAAVQIALKIAAGVAAKAPEAVALYEQFQSGNMPTQAELDAYAAAETGSYNRLMADIAAAQKNAT